MGGLRTLAVWAHNLRRYELGRSKQAVFPPAQLEPNRMVGVFINSSNRSARSKSENAHEVHGLTATEMICWLMGQRIIKGLILTSQGSDM